MQHRASPRTCGEAVNLPNTLRIGILRITYKIPLQSSMVSNAVPGLSPPFPAIKCTLFPRPDPTARSFTDLFKTCCLQSTGCFLGSRKEEVGEEEEEDCRGQGRRGGIACVGQEGWVRWDRTRMERGGGGLQQHSQQEGQEKSRTQRQRIIYRKKPKPKQENPPHTKYHHNTNTQSLQPS